jgi:hypothetical protein
VRILSTNLAQLGRHWRFRSLKNVMGRVLDQTEDSSCLVHVFVGDGSKIPYQGYELVFEIWQENRTLSAFAVLTLIVS